MQMSERHLRHVLRQHFEKVKMLLLLNLVKALRVRVVKVSIAVKVATQVQIKKYILLRHNLGEMAQAHQRIMKVPLPIYKVSWL